MTSPQVCISFATQGYYNMSFGVGIVNPANSLSNVVHFDFIYLNTNSSEQSTLFSYSQHIGASGNDDEYFFVGPTSFIQKIDDDITSVYYLSIYVDATTGLSLSIVPLTFYSVSIGITLVSLLLPPLM